MCVQMHVPLCVYGGQRLAFMCVQKMLVHVCVIPVLLCVCGARDQS